jgi:hypothetical protein
MSVISLVTTGNVAADNFGFPRDISPFWGDLAELIIYDRPLPGDERKSVEDYLLAKYEIGPVTTPMLVPAGGSFTASVSVTIANRTPGAEVFYTLDGTEPTVSSTPYAGPIEISSTVTLKAKAFRDGLGDSATATAGFTRDGDFAPPAVPGLQLWWRADAGVASGVADFWADQSGNGNHGVQAASSAVARLVPNAVNGLPVMHFDGGDAAYFTTRLTTIRTVFWVLKEDTAATHAYRGLLGDATVRDFEGGYGAPGPIWRPDCCVSPSIVNGQTWLNGAPVNGRTTLRPRTMSVISLVTTGNVSASNFGFPRDISPFWGDLAELIIYDRPLSSGERKALDDYLLAKYAIGPVTAPAISPAGATFTGSVSASISIATPEAEIFYTLDGTEPTTSSTPYTGPIAVTSTVTLKAKAFRTGLAPSATTTAGFIEGAAFNPAKVGGLKLWWRADAGAPSGFGEFWEDQSAAENHGVQNSSLVARVVPDAVNHLPVMRFDGGDSVAFTTRLTTIKTVFWVVKEDEAATHAYRGLLGDGTVRDFEGGYGAPGPIWRPDCCVSTNITGGKTYLNGVLVDGRSTPRPRQMAVISMVTTQNGTVTADNFGFARDISPFWGDLAELVIYDVALGDTDRRKVEDYLNNRYRIFTR